MNIAFFHSNHGGSPLVGGLQRGLEALGHSVQMYDATKEYDLILIFNQCSHTTAYVYPEFPKSSAPMAFVDSAEYGYFKRLPGVVNKYANTFSMGAMAHDTKNPHEQSRLKEYLEGKSFPYFLREHSIYIDFPPEYHPIDYPLYVYSACPLEPNRDEYLSRPLDLFSCWGSSHPWRIPLTQILRFCHVKCEIGITGDHAGFVPGTEAPMVPRMPQGLFLQRTRAAKCCPSFDGYGSGSFRMMETLVRTLLIQGPLTIRRHAPLLDKIHCLEYRIWNDGEQFISSNICEVIHGALADPEGSFNIYAAGYAHCMDYYTERSTAEYVLQVVNHHDWKKPTKLDL